MKRLLYAIPLFAVPFIIGLRYRDDPAKSERHMSKVAASTPQAKSDTPRPRIDVDAPSKVETATFALG